MITDEMLRKAAENADTALMEQLEPLAGCTYQFSDAFEKKMKKMLWREKHPGLSFIRKGAACIVVVVLVGISALLTFDSTARSAVTGWIKEQYEKYVKYYFSGDSEVKEKKNYYLGYVPEGYEEIERYEGEEDIWITYANSEGQYLNFIYMDSSSESALFIMQQEQLEKESVIVAGNLADFYESQSSEIASELIWIDEENENLFDISGFFSKEELIHIAECIQEE